MKNKSGHITLEKSSANFPKKHIEHKYLNRNSTSANISIEINNSLFNKFENFQYQTIEKDFEGNKKIIKNSNKNFNFSQGKYYQNHNKDFFQRNGHHKKIYLPKGFKSYQDYKNKINKGLKPFNLYSQSIENKYNKKIFKLIIIIILKKIYILLIIIIMNINILKRKKYQKKIIILIIIFKLIQNIIKIIIIIILQMYH